MGEKNGEMKCSRESYPADDVPLSRMKLRDNVLELIRPSKGLYKLQVCISAISLPWLSSLALAGRNILFQYILLSDGALSSLAVEAWVLFSVVLLTFSLSPQPSVSFFFSFCLENPAMLYPGSQMGLEIVG